MTAINFFRAHDRAWFVTDGAAIDDEGRLVSLHRKIRRIDAFDAVVTSSGALGGDKVFEDLVVSKFDSIDDLAESGEPVFRAVRDFLAERSEHYRLPYAILVAGWSEAKAAPRCVVFSSNEDVFFDPDLSWWLTPMIPDEHVVPFLQSVRSMDRLFGKFDPAIHAKRLVDFQRQKRMNSDFAEGCHFVGGHVQVTEINAKGVTQTIVHEWPEDRIGERINPFASAPMSRQQRRALERQTGRIAA